MVTESEILHSRAPETRKVLAKINGWALNWATTLLGLLFVGAIFAATQISFDVNAHQLAEINADGNFELDSPFEKKTAQKVLVKTAEKTYEVTVVPEDQLMQLSPTKPLPKELNGPVQLVYKSEISLLGAVFNGIF